MWTLNLQHLISSSRLLWWENKGSWTLSALPQSLYQPISIPPPTPSFISDMPLKPLSLALMGSQLYKQSVMEGYWHQVQAVFSLESEGSISRWKAPDFSYWTLRPKPLSEAIWSLTASWNTQRYQCFCSWKDNVWLQLTTIMCRSSSVRLPALLHFKMQQPKYVPIVYQFAMDVRRPMATALCAKLETIVWNRLAQYRQIVFVITIMGMCNISSRTLASYALTLFLAVSNAALPHLVITVEMWVCIPGIWTDQFTNANAPTTRCW